MTNKDTVKTEISTNGPDHPYTALPDVPFSSNGIRLSPREAIVAAIIVAVLFVMIPKGWCLLEKFEPSADYRVPYDLSSDYWLYERYCRWAADKYETVVIGDSVVWGHYVPPDNTLSQHLNRIVGSNEFANLGVDGIHPVALAGLIKYYSRSISGKNVILCFNPLWMTSRKHDLQTEKEFHFNHPRLAPQFLPKIPCYRETSSQKIGITLERNLAFLSWASHLQQISYDNLPPSLWSLEHPYDNIFHGAGIEASADLKTTASESDTEFPQTSWRDRGLGRQDFPWVELETSLQWRFFCEAVETLQKRNNRVFIIVGPFNEHMMKGDSIQAYEEIKKGIGTWLRKNNIPHYLPPSLPSKNYADASHPLSKGYALLGEQLCRDESFGRIILHRIDASVKSTLPPRFWSVAVVFAAFFGLLAVASEL
ncbi:MAG: hypothetical protein KAJ52_00440 [Sedimentisphaerales bacterium]|nr:hypothetical protein [Sedimentisphaerales bacterium]